MDKLINLGTASVETRNTFIRIDPSQEPDGVSLNNVKLGIYSDCTDSEDGEEQDPGHLCIVGG